MDLANMMASQSEETANPMLFNLVDLILVCLRSGIQQTIAVTLQLVSVILRRHHQYAVTTLLRTARLMTEGPQTTVGAHEIEMRFLISLADDIGAGENLDEAYENYVKDCMVLLESHPCSQTLIAPRAAKDAFKLPGAQASIPGGPREVRSHTLRPDDPLLKTILGIFETFFVNPVETNLCLTATVIDLATCGYMSVEGWLLPDPSKYTYDDLEDAKVSSMTVMESDTNSSKISERSKNRAIQLARRTPNWPPPELPALLNHLQILVSHVAVYRSGIPRFDELLQQRHQAIHAESVQDTPKPVHQNQRSSFDSSSPSRSASPPPIRQSAFNSLAQQIFPSLASPSRSSSPRGRRSQDQQRSSMSQGTGTPAPISIQSSRTARIPPSQFPMGGSLETPSRGSSRAFSSSPLRGSESTPTASRGLASQVAAFAEVDKAILARKVGMPTPQGELVPPPFPNLAPNILDQDSAVAVESDDCVAAGSPVAKRDESPDTDGEQFVDAPEEAQVDAGEDEEEDKKLVSVSHVLTNVVLLQEFLLELAALVQVRAGLFGEVRFI